MKKCYLIAILSMQILCACTASGDKKPSSYRYQKKPRNFSNLTDDYQPKLTTSKKINPSETAYIGTKSKYVLRNPEFDSQVKVDPVLKENELNFTNSENDILGLDDEDAGIVVSSELDNESDQLPEDSENKPDQKYEGSLKIGTPYKIDGITYYPEKYENFEEVGQASWYGDEFDGKKTANGETYNMQDFTAAHRTLPLPSMVKVTNLNNGKSVIVRVNDRGPFARNRIIDVSQKAAEQLDFKGKGTTNVKVQFLKSETKILWNKIIKESKEDKK